MRVARILLIVDFAAASATALAANDKISAEDFVKKAGEAGAAEVAMGKLGAAKATDTDVKAFAQHMLKDHTKANQELMAAAKPKGLKVPTTLDPDLRALAKKTLPTLEEHLADAQKLESKWARPSTARATSEQLR